MNVMNVTIVMNVMNVTGVAIVTLLCLGTGFLASYMAKFAGKNGCSR